MFINYYRSPNCGGDESCRRSSSRTTSSLAHHLQLLQTATAGGMSRPHPARPGPARPLSIVPWRSPLAWRQGSSASGGDDDGAREPSRDGIGEGGGLEGQAWQTVGRLTPYYNIPVACVAVNCSTGDETESLLYFWFNLLTLFELCKQVSLTFQTRFQCIITN